MGWQFSEYVVVLGLTSVLSLYLSYKTYRNVSKRAAPQVLGILAEAHGWSVSATAATNGGARFEITGVGDNLARPIRDPARETT